MPNIDLALVICNHGMDREKIVAALLRCGLGPICCSNLQEACTLLSQEAFRLIQCSDTLSDDDFRTAPGEVKKSSVQASVIVLSRADEWDWYLKAFGVGTFDSIVCPPDPTETERILWSALAVTMRPEKSTDATA